MLRCIIGRHQGDALFAAFGYAARSEPAVDLTDPVVVSALARVGRVLREKWRLDRLIGVGGMAAVYEATHRNGKRWAIKMLHAELSVDQEVRRRFLKEGYVANAIGHPGCVAINDDDVAEDGAAFLVMELLVGETLETRRERLGRLDPDEVLSITDQVLDVLVAAHAQGVVHRDLKPENLFLTTAGSIRVLDFGIARLRQGSSTGATQAGMTMGTPAYMPNEQARGLWEEVDGRTDLWALGATMFTLLTGQVVHSGRTPNEQLLSAMTKPAPPIATLVGGLSPGVARVIDCALAFHQSERWPDARTMQEALRAAYHQVHGAAIGTAPKLAVPELPDPDDEVKTVAYDGLAEAVAAYKLSQTPSGGEPVPTGRTVSPVVPPAPRVSPALLLALGGAAMVLSVAIVLGFVVLRPGTTEPAPAPASGTAERGGPPAASTAATVPTAPPGPVVTPAPAASTDAPSAKGKLSVSARGGACQVTVTGAVNGVYGSTPAGPVDLDEGEYVVRCKTGEGTLTQTVRITRGQTTQAQFVLDKPSPAPKPGPVDAKDRRR